MERESAGLVAERLWTHEETARWLHISVWTLHHLVTAGDGPPVYLVARRARRYDPSEVRQWVRQHRIRTQSRVKSPEGTSLPEPEPEGGELHQLRAERPAPS